MHISTHLDIDLIALDSADDVTCLVELTAPVPEEALDRPGQVLVVVLDRSGSMRGEPLEGSKEAIVELVKRLAPQDQFGLVVFDDQADVVSPVSSMADHDLPQLIGAIMAVQSGGSTDLSAGYTLGLREAKRARNGSSAASSTVLLVSDGFANAGVVDPVVLEDVARTAHLADATVSSTMGFGLGYDELLLSAITAGGSGEHRFAPDVDTVKKEMAEAVTGLLNKSVLGALMRITPLVTQVSGIEVRNNLPNWAEGDSVVVNLGDFYASEERKTLVRFQVPEVAELGTITIATITMEFTTLPDLQLHTVELPISVNIVPGDEVAGRVPNPKVTLENLLVEADRAKKEAADRLRDGDSRSASNALRKARKDLDEQGAHIAGIADVHTSARFEQAREDLEYLAVQAEVEPVAYSSKMMQEAWMNESRGRNPRKR